jgi:hypothetical protein
LNLTIKAIEKQRTKLMRQLGVRNSAGLVRCAIEKDLLPKEKSFPAEKPFKEVTTIK